MIERTGAVTVFYDGACPLCSAEIGMYRQCDGAVAVEFVDVSVSEPGTIATGLDKATAMKRLHVRGADGTLHSGAAGFGNLWLVLPKWRWLGRIILLPGLLQVSELAYRGFLIFRPALQWMMRARASSGKRS